MRLNLFTLLFCIIIPFSSYAAERDGRELLNPSALTIVGGFKIPKIELDSYHHTPHYLDINPSNQHWVAGHQKGYVVELLEPGALGTGDSSTWPQLIVSRTQAALQSTDKIAPNGVFWLDADTVLASGRKSYRSYYTENSLSKLNMNTGSETYYTIRSASNTEWDNFHVLQALGSGFVRISGTTWSTQHAKGSDYLLGRGGYDVLGSPLGPAMGYWNGSDENITWYLDFPIEHPARRDNQYWYPDTYDGAQLPMWLDPDEGGGYWQAGDVGGITYIDHPSYTGFLATHNHGRGLHDYRSQGDCGSGKFFLVADPSVFYAIPEEGTCTGNRGSHQEETINASYDPGTYARVGRVYSPDQIAEIATGKRDPWDIQAQLFDWPTSGLTWTDAARDPTLLGSVTWDRSRNYLWAVIGTSKEAYLVAYELGTVAPNIINITPSSQ